MLLPVRSLLFSSRFPHLYYYDYLGGNKNRQIIETNIHNAITNNEKQTSCLNQIKLIQDELRLLHPFTSNPSRFS